MYQSHSHHSPHSRHGDGGGVDSGGGGGGGLGGNKSWICIAFVCVLLLLLFQPTMSTPSSGLTSTSTSTSTAKAGNTCSRNSKDGTCHNNEHGASSSSSISDVDACFDRHPKCLFWAERGECTKNTPFMTKACRQSCELCPALPMPPVELYIDDDDDKKKKECFDMHPKCSQWASRGECVANPMYMKDACKRSCFICIDIEHEKNNGVPEQEILQGFRFVHGEWGVEQQSTMDDVVDTRTTSTSQSFSTTALQKVLISMWDYARINVTMELSLEERLLCHNKLPQCAVWAMQGKCQATIINTSISTSDTSALFRDMMYNCPLACQQCDQTMLYHKCHVENHDDDHTNQIGNSKETWFDTTLGWTRILKHVQELYPNAKQLVSNPSRQQDATNTTTTAPWVIQLDHFLNATELEPWMELLQSESSSTLFSWEELKPYAIRNVANVNQKTKWIRQEGFATTLTIDPTNNTLNYFHEKTADNNEQECDDNKTTTRMMTLTNAALSLQDKLSSLVSYIPNDETPTTTTATRASYMKQYMEPMQLVHYKRFQSVGAHHDVLSQDLWMPAGPRALTMFLCLSNHHIDNNNDNASTATNINYGGGAMGFPDLDWLSIPPQQGQLLIWPNIDVIPMSNEERQRADKDQHADTTTSTATNVLQKHELMSSEVLPMIHGEKTGIYTWFRLYNYETAKAKGCV